MMEEQQHHTKRWQDSSNDDDKEKMNVTTKTIKSSIDFNYYQEIPSPGIVESHPLYGYLISKDRIEGLQVYFQKRQEEPQTQQQSSFSPLNKQTTTTTTTISSTALQQQNMIKHDHHLQPKYKNHHHHYPICICIVQLGNKVQGHQDIVHGGLLALLIDEAIGLGCEALTGGLQAMAFTAKLTINYRNPCPVNSRLRISVYLQLQNDDKHNITNTTNIATLDESQYSNGRKLYWTCHVESDDNDTTTTNDNNNNNNNTNGRTLYCEATSLFLLPKNVSLETILTASEQVKASHRISNL